MGTKNNPGTYDCWATLDPDEPYFLIRAWDPMGATLVRNWAQIRQQQVEMGHKPAADMAQVAEARALASQMETWRAAKLRAEIDAATYVPPAVTPPAVPAPPPAGEVKDP